MNRHDKQAIDSTWAQIEAERNLQKVKILLAEALVHIEDAETLNREALNGWISSALLVCSNKKDLERGVKKTTSKQGESRYA